MTSSHINTIWLQLQIQITSFQISIRRLLLNWINRKCLCVLSTMLDAACMEKNKTSLRRHKSLKTHTFSCGQWMATQFWESRSLQSSRGILRGKWEKKSAKMQKSEIYARSQGGRTAEDGRGQQRRKDSRGGRATYWAWTICQTQVTYYPVATILEMMKRRQGT